jgi:hypothetical protein
MMMKNPVLFCVLDWPIVHIVAICGQMSMRRRESLVGRSQSTLIPHTGLSSCSLWPTSRIRPIIFYRPALLLSLLLITPRQRLASKNDSNLASGAWENLGDRNLMATEVTVKEGVNLTSHQLNNLLATSWKPITEKTSLKSIESHERTNWQSNLDPLNLVISIIQAWLAERRCTECLRRKEGNYVNQQIFRDTALLSQ